MSVPEWLSSVNIHVVVLPMRTRFRGITAREVALLHGAHGWGEFGPFLEYGPRAAVPWLRSAYESATAPWPAPRRTNVAVNVTVPAVSPERAHETVATSGCATAKVKVAEPGQTLDEDVARVAAVTDALGPGGRVRVDANAAWTVPEAVTAIGVLDAAAGGLEYAEQPCRTIEELAAVRGRVAVPIAADESIRLAEDPLRVAVAGAADIAVIKVAPLGGVAAALAVAQACGLPCVVSSALDTSVGLAAGVALAAALPALPYACGLGTGQLLAADISADPLLPVDGMLPVRRTVVDEQLVSRYAATAPRRDWWLARIAATAELLG